MKKSSETLQKLNTFFKKFGDDNLSPISAEVTLFTVISAFPFLMFLFSLLSITPIEQTVLFDLLDRILPEAILPYAREFIKQVIPQTGGTFTLLTALAFLWAGSKSFIAIERGLNSIYNQTSRRNMFSRRFLSIIYTIVFAIFILLLLVFFVFGNLLFDKIEHAFPVTYNIIETIRSSRLPVLAAALLFFFTSIFKVIPNRQSHKTSIITELPGSIIATGGWIGFSYLYSLYVDKAKNLATIYGSLTAVVLLLLWLYICSFIMFVGAEINSILKLYEVRARILERRAKRQLAKEQKRELKAQGQTLPEPLPPEAFGHGPEPADTSETHTE